MKDYISYFYDIAEDCVYLKVKISCGNIPNDMLERLVATPIAEEIQQTLESQRIFARIFNSKNIHAPD